MQKVLIIIIGVVIVAGLVFMLVLWLMTPKPQGTSTPPTSTGGSVPAKTVNTPPSVEQSITLTTADGGTLVVDDFKSDPTTKTSSNIPQYYFLAGGIDPSATNAPYSTFYLESDESFNITLLQEPIGQTRLQAETELRQKLDISQTDMCRLRYWVGVPRWVNEIYAGKNLGFSFCPGTTQL